MNTQGHLVHKVVLKNGTAINSIQPTDAAFSKPICGWCKDINAALEI